MTKAPSSLEEMREMAAQIIEQHQIMHGPDGASLCRRRDGAIDGLVYAEAIRAIPATVQPAQMRVKPLVFDDLGIASDNLLNETIVYRKPEDQDRHNAKRAARILAALEPQPDPRDEVIARLVDALADLRHNIGCAALVKNPAGIRVRAAADAALAAAKAVQK